jgi:hypothetical protein
MAKGLLESYKNNEAIKKKEERKRTKNSYNYQKKMIVELSRN